MFADFAGVCFDQIANQLAKYRYMTGGQVQLPVTIRLANGAGAGFAAQHSQPVENWFLNVPGLKIVTPATPADAYGLLRAAIRDPDPVLFFEHKSLLNVKGPLPDASDVARLGRAEVVRSGDDVTVVASQLMRHRALEAAHVLAAEGIDVELIDPRTLVPFDFEAVRAERRADEPARRRPGGHARRELGRDAGGAGGDRGVRVAGRTTGDRRRRRHAGAVLRRPRGCVAPRRPSGSRRRSGVPSRSEP